MRKLTITIFLLILVGILVSSNSFKKMGVNSLEKSTYDTFHQNKDVVSSIKEKSITPETEFITIAYTNLSSKKYTYGEKPYLEMKIGGEWYVVPTIETAAWNDVMNILLPNESREDRLYIKGNYGQLKAGNYRVVKMASIAESEIQLVN